MVEESDAGEPMSAAGEPTSAGGPKVSFAPAKIPGELRHCLYVWKLFDGFFCWDWACRVALLTLL